MNPRLRQLLKRAEQLAEQRRWETSERSYRDLVAEAPELVEGWLGLAQVIQNEEERQAIFLRVINLDPQNQIAKQGIAGNLIPLPLQPIKEVAVEENEASPVIVNDQKQSDNSEEAIGLRCNRCGKLLDAKTAIRTPVGYRCKACLKEMQDSFYTATVVDYIVAVVVALPISLVAGWLCTLAGFLVIILAAAVGTTIGAVIWRLVGRRRGRYLPMIIAGCVALGGVAPLILTFNFYAIFYAVIAAASAFYRLHA